MPPSPTGTELVDAYLARVPRPLRTEMERVRAAIRASAPGAEEVVSYRMPAFRLEGMLVYYGAFTDHGSLFVGGAGARRRLAKEIAPYETGTGTLHFTPEKPLPLALIRKVVRARVQENRARAKARAGPTPGAAVRRPKSKERVGRGRSRRPA